MPVVALASNNILERCHFWHNAHIRLSANHRGSGTALVSSLGWYTHSRVFLMYSTGILFESAAKISIFRLFSLSS